MVRGDLADLGAVTKSCRGIDCVFHAGGRVGIWGPWDEYLRANVVGTENVIAACRTSGVGRLVFTSSPSVTFDGSNQCGVDESAQYPTSWLAHYPHSKALAEQAVSSANDKQSLRTCSLRPHLVWGPRDHHLTARLVSRARAKAAANRRRHELGRYDLRRERRRRPSPGGRCTRRDRFSNGGPGIFFKPRRAGELLAVDRRHPGAGRICRRCGSQCRWRRRDGWAAACEAMWSVVALAE